jgi:pyruvate dehydrogenase E2 component (dihydrolipoamide acetyltransferase)
MDSAAPTTGSAGRNGGLIAPPHPKATPIAKRIAETHGIDIFQVTPAEPAGKVTRRDVERYLSERQEAGSAPRPRATPAARRIGRDSGVDLWAVQGSGPRRRIQAADVLTAAQNLAHTDSTGEGLAAGSPVPDFEPEAVEVIPLAGKRRTIAERMQQSYQSAPHITFSIDVDMSEAENLRRKLNKKAEASSAPHITVTAILVKICAWALKQHPWLNTALRGDEINFYSTQNIGVAVAAGGDLIVPVIQHAGDLSIPAIAARIHDLSEKVRQERLTLTDIRGGTFTISNLGMTGIDQFSAIINPPQAAILAVGSIKKRAVVVEAESGDQLVIKPMMTLNLSADHRVVNGLEAANFLKEIANALEDPSLLFWE